MTAPQITRQSWVMVFTLGLVWGGTFLITDMALNGITPFWLAASRIALAATIMTPFWVAGGGTLFSTKPRRKDWVKVALIAALNTAVPFVLLAWGQQFVTSGFAGVSMASGALFALPLTLIFLPGDPITWNRATGFLCGFAGVVALIGPSNLAGAKTDMEFWGQIACVSASCCYVSGGILTRRLPDVNPVGLATVLMMIASVYSIPLAWAVEGAPKMPDTATLGWLLLLGLVPTAAANYLRVLVVRSAGPLFMSLVGYQVPVWSVILGAYVLGEHLPVSLFYALGLFLLGLAMAQMPAFIQFFKPSKGARR